jgi:hypothetical protein
MSDDGVNVTLHPLTSDPLIIGYSRNLAQCSAQFGHDILFAWSGLQRVTNQSSGTVVGSCTRGPGQGVRGMGMSGATSADRGWGPINRSARLDSINTQGSCI